MVKKITIELDLNKLHIINPHFYVHGEELLISDIINYTPNRIVYVASLEMKDMKKDNVLLESKKEEILKRYNLERFETFSIDKISNRYTVLISQKFPAVLKGLIKRYYDTIFLVPPIRISRESMKFNFLVLENESKKFLALLDELNVSYSVKKTSELFSERIPTKSYYAKSKNLTSRQAKVLKIAYDLGYFDIPRKLSMKQFSSELEISPASTHRILKRIERKAIIGLLETL